MHKHGRQRVSPRTFSALCLSVALLSEFCMRPVHAVELATPAPAIALPQLQSDQQVTLASLRGRVVLVDFWASWCGPCVESLPQYQKLWDEFAREDFEVLAVNLDEDKGDALAFLKRHPLKFLLVRDAEGAVATAYALKGMPSSYLIDREGVLRSRHVGFNLKDLAPLRSKIQELVAEKPVVQPTITEKTAEEKQHAN